MKIKYFLFLCLLFCSGCIPCPHFKKRIPRITATVTKNGAPLSGAVIRISDTPRSDSSCNPAAVVLSTDALGRIDFKGAKYFKMFAPLMGDPFYSTQLCIITEKEVYMGYLGGGIHLPDAVDLRCDITPDSKPVNEKTPMSVIDKYAVCTVIRQSD